MSQSKLFGLNKLIPGPDFRMAIDSQGVATASQTYRTGREYAETVMRTVMLKGNTANAINPSLGTAFDFLIADTIERTDGPGGIVEFAVTYVGQSWWATFDGDRESTFSLNATTTEVSIIRHPAVQKLHYEHIKALQLAIDGVGKVKDGTTSASIKESSVMERTLASIEGEEPMKWWDRIYRRGLRTYLAPALEWTWHTSNRGGISNSMLEKLGYIDDSPRGNPPTPGTRNWLMTGATESKTRAGENSTSSFSITWTLSEPGRMWDPDIYDKSKVES